MKYCPHPHECGLQFANVIGLLTQGGHAGNQAASLPLSRASRSTHFIRLAIQAGLLIVFKSIHGCLNGDQSKIGEILAWAKLHRAYSNNEVTFIARDVDGLIDGCLDFDVVRIRGDGSELPQRVSLPGFSSKANQIRRGRPKMRGSGLFRSCTGVILRCAATDPIPVFATTISASNTQLAR